MHPPQCDGEGVREAGREDRAVRAQGLLVQQGEARG